MPFSFFAARCIYVAKQPLQYRRDVIRRIFKARIAAHTTLFTVAQVPNLISSIPMLS